MITSIVEFCTELLKLLQFWNKSKAGDAAVTLADMYDQMGTLLHPKGINRILIIWYHNSGGDVRNDKPCYSTCVHEVKVDELESVKRKYKGMEMDVPYAKFVRDIYIDRVVDININTMHRGLLEKAYHDEHVCKARVHFIKHTKKGVWFVAFRSGNEAYQFDDQFVEIQGVVSCIRKTI